MANRSLLRDAARLELSILTTDTTTWTNNQLNRVVDEVTADIERLLPREQVEELVFAQTVTDESVTFAALDTDKDLANKPVEHGTVVVTDSPATVTYTEDTDYEIDYINGTIRALTGGAIGGTATVLVDYQVSAIILDISGITNMIAPLEVEWPIDLVPQSFTSFKKFGDFLHLVTKGMRSQQKMADADHVRIWYAGRHTAPTDGADGTFPRFLDEVMVKGMVAYALFIKHREANLQSRTDVASARTALLAADDDNTLITTALAAIATQVGSASTDLDALDTAALHAAILTFITDADTDLNALETADIHTTVNAVLGSIAALQAAVATALDTTAPTVATVRDDADAAVNRVVTELDLANAALDKVATEIGDGTGSLGASVGSANLYLNVGDALLNTVPVGGLDTPLQYVQYALAKVNTAGRYIEEAQGRVAHGLAIIQEASSRLALFDRILAEAQLRQSRVDSESLEAQSRLQHFQAYLNEASARTQLAQLSLQHFQEYLTESNQRLQVAQGYAIEAQSRLAREQRFIQIAQSYFAAANQETITADRFLADARERHSDYIRTLTSRVQQFRQRSFASAQQWAEIGERGVLYPTGRET